MRKWPAKYFSYTENLIIGFIFLVLFVLPVLFTRIEGEISWQFVIKIWKDQFLLFPIFILNHWVLAPRLMLRRKYTGYIVSILLVIVICSFSYYYYDEVLNGKPSIGVETGMKRPTPIPPYAHLLMYSLLIAGVDTGLLSLKKWHENEEKRHILEKENAEIRLDILRNQISPHFFMNTLNNIYALIDFNTPKAKEAVMKLSKLMRYMLYENENGKVKLSKEFVFIQSYIDLMKLRFADELTVNLVLPSNYNDVDIPPMLFVSFIENAFKYGASYQKESFINIIFEMRGDKLHLTCMNTKHNRVNETEKGGLGLQNSKNRLNMLYGDNYNLSVSSGEDMYSVELEIPLV